MDSTKIMAGKPHRHAEMIKAKADNMELVVFCKGINDGCEWHEVKRFPNWQDNASYFLCLPQHKEACLHWLNRGEIAFKSEIAHEWTEYDPIRVWGVGSVFMQSDYKFRVKPRKEKRFICITQDGHVGNCHYASIEELKSRVSAPNGFDGWQLIEIEVEV